MIDREKLRSLSELADPLGVLSVYVDADPRLQARRPTPWETAVRGQLREQRARVSATEPRGRAKAILARLDDLEPEIEAVLHPTLSGRGRALFATLEAGVADVVGFDLPVETQVVVDGTAFVRPLLALLERGRPAGLATVSRSGVAVFGWELGRAEELAHWSFDDQTREWRRMKGPAGANPAYAQQTAPQHDRFERRLEHHQLEFVKSLADEIAALGQRHGWRRIVLAGDPRLTHSLDELLSASLEGGIVRSDRHLQDLSPQRLADALLPDLDAERTRQRRQLVATVIDLARAGGRATVGLRGTVAALNDARVDTLLIERDRAYAGLRAADGSLFADAEPQPGVEPSGLQDELRLGERMIERVLATSGEVVTLEPTDAEPLTPDDGLAALLRW